MFESKKLMKCDIEVLKSDVAGIHTRLDRVYERVDNRFTVQNNTISQFAGQIELLTKQIKDLARLCDCTVTPPKEADPGGVVRKLTEEEKESRSKWNEIYNGIYGSSITSLLRGTSAPLPTQMPKKKQKSVKKKK